MSIALIIVISHPGKYEYCSADLAKYSCYTVSNSLQVWLPELQRSLSITKKLDEYVKILDSCPESKQVNTVGFVAKKLRNVMNNFQEHVSLACMYKYHIHKIFKG